MDAVVVRSGLAAGIGTTAGSLELDFRIDVEMGQTVAVVGPNGAGKTTALRVLAGLHPLSHGTVELGGVVLEDTRSAVNVAPENRPVGVVFQDHVLFPHLSALDNVAFGLRHRRGHDRRQARAGAAEWLDRMGMAGEAHLRPRQLSGGQSQRVALARALAVDPDLLLLDEPLSALDVQTRAGVRRQLVRHLAESSCCRVLVTHDPVEAIAMAERIVVVEEGRATQMGSVDELMRRPRSRYVADLVGINLFRGTASPGQVLLAGGGAMIAVAGDARGEVLAVAHPRAVALYRSPPEGTPRNVWASTVVDLERHADRVRVRLQGEVPLVAEVTAAAAEDLGLSAGASVWASVKATEVEVYPA